MNRALIFCVGALCGGGATACIYNCHIVQTKENWLLVPRSGMSLTDVYADVRSWSLSDWRNHPDLARDMLKAGYAETIKEHAVSDAVDESLDRLTQRSDDTRPSRRKADTAEDDFDPQFAPE
jgi:hypothetical protein